MAMKKYSVKIANHPSSISLEEEFWIVLKNIAQNQRKSLNALVTEIDKKKETDNLSSAIRVYILKHMQE